MEFLTQYNTSFSSMRLPCFHGDGKMLYIDPDECIDCSACIAECPVEAIYSEDEVPESEMDWIRINAERASGLPVIVDTTSPLPGAEERRQALGF